MNQRIQELWRECVLKHTKNPMNWQMAANEFAELIVRECANIDFRREVGLTADDDYEVGKVIKEHFGVTQ